MLTPQPVAVRDTSAPVARWGIIIPVMTTAVLVLSGCISPKIEICNVHEACTVNAPATVNPIQLPKVLP